MARKPENLPDQMTLLASRFQNLNLHPGAGRKRAAIAASLVQGALLIRVQIVDRGCEARRFGMLKRALSGELKPKSSVRHGQSSIARNAHGCRKRAPSRLSSAQIHPLQIAP